MAPSTRKKLTSFLWYLATIDDYLWLRTNGTTPYEARWQRSAMRVVTSSRQGVQKIKGRPTTSTFVTNTGLCDPIHHLCRCGRVWMGVVLFYVTNGEGHSIAYSSKRLDSWTRVIWPRTRITSDQDYSYQMAPLPSLEVIWCISDKNGCLWMLHHPIVSL